MLALVRLDGLERRKPDQLSGGQRQRVALARALVKRPKVFLLDEPLAALDKKLRAETQFELMELQEKLGLTFVIVTHDQEEAMTVADRIAVMDRGSLVQVATPSEIYEQPGSRWVAEFIGDVNIIEGRVAGRKARRRRIESVAAGALRVAQGPASQPGDTVCVAVRPEKIRIARESAGAGDENCVAGRVVDIGYLGDISIYKVRLENGFVVKAKAANTTRLVEQPIGAGDRVWLSFHARMRRRADTLRTEIDGAKRAERPGVSALMVLVPYLWLAVFFLVPFLIVFKISLSQTVIAQPPYSPVLDLAAGWPGLRDFVAGLSFDSYATLFSDALYLSSYLKSLQVALVSTAILLVIGLPIAYGLARSPRAAAADPGHAGGAAVLDRVPDPHLCLGQHPAARGPAQRGAAGARHRRRAADMACDRHRGLYRHRLFLSAVHDPADLRDAREDGRCAARSRRRSRLPALEGILARHRAASRVPASWRARCCASSRSPANS